MKTSRQKKPDKNFPPPPPKKNTENWLNVERLKETFKINNSMLSKLHKFWFDDVRLVFFLPPPPALTTHFSARHLHRKKKTSKFLSLPHSSNFKNSFDCFNLFEELRANFIPEFKNVGFDFRNRWFQKVKKKKNLETISLD